MSEDNEGMDWDKKLFDISTEKMIQDAKDGSFKASLTVLAKLIKGYYESLLDAGLEESFAKLLTIQYQKNIINGATKKRDNN